MRRFLSRDGSPPSPTVKLKSYSPWHRPSPFLRDGSFPLSLPTVVAPSSLRPPPVKPIPANPFSFRTSALPDILSTSLFALKESADAFPPLKSAVGGVLAVWDVAQRAKHSKSDACEIALRTEKILNVIADAVPDGSAISSPLLDSIERFTVLLDLIRCSMEAIAFSGGVDRLVHLRRNERALRAIKTQLDDAYHDLLAASVLRGEVQQTQLADQQADFGLQIREVQLGLKTVAALSKRLLRYAQITCFFGRPLMLPYKFIRYPIRPDTHHARGTASQGTNPVFFFLSSTVLKRGHWP
ncbi:hypothetical protein B0H14DRAFT_2882902 [Mycena olivaceomarginata]|nr:hypothetical protein B0H14DRAFT_2882902 [Mycena olivaceomarginata]